MVTALYDKPRICGAAIAGYDAAPHLTNELDRFQAIGHRLRFLADANHVPVDGAAPQVWKACAQLLA